MLTRWHPLTDVQSEMNRLHDEMNRLFGRYSNGSRDLASRGYPPLNMWEDKDCFYVEAELPGFDLNDLEIYVTGENQLSIKGERKQPEVEKGTWHRQERGYGTFQRLMRLPSLVDADQVSAAFKHGVLTITIAKKEETKPRRIEVKAG